MLRAPAESDLIVPTVRGTLRHEHTSLDLLRRDATRIGIPDRRFHDLRHTHISIMQDAGAPRDVVEMWTHASKMRVIDRYTHLHWQTKCAAMLALRVDVSLSEPPSLPPAPDALAYDAVHDVEENPADSTAILATSGRPQRDSNPRTRDENPVSWAGLDDGDLMFGWLSGFLGLRRRPGT